MNAKPTAEQFINEYFQQRTTGLKLSLEIHHAYWRRYYHPDCHRDSRRGVVENSEAETVVSVSGAEGEADVITTGSPIYRSRYHLRASSSDSKWLIHAVDTECGLCTIKGLDAKCVICGGAGWLNAKLRTDLLSQLTARMTTCSIPEKIEDDCHLHSSVEQFMTDHFRDHVASVKRETEICSAYRDRFFSPECDWGSNREAVQWCEAEKIMTIGCSGDDTFVVTEGFGLWRLRYHLRPNAAQGWLIWDVDSECPVCWHKGKTASCFLCCGTGWAKSKRSRGPGQDGAESSASGK